MLFNCGVGELLRVLGLQGDPTVHPKGDQCWVFIERTDVEVEVWYFGHLMQRTDSFEKTLMLGKIEGKEEKGVAEDEMVGWHHWLSGHEFELPLGDGEGQGSLVCCSPWDFRVRHDWATEKQYILYEHMSVNLMNENTIFYISCMKTCAYFMYKNSFLYYMKVCMNLHV